jgi:hypothetical protein
MDLLSINKIWPRNRLLKIVYHRPSKCRPKLSKTTPWGRDNQEVTINQERAATADGELLLRIKQFLNRSQQVEILLVPSTILFKFRILFRCLNSSILNNRIRTIYFHPCQLKGMPRYLETYIKIRA